MFNGVLYDCFYFNTVNPKANLINLKVLCNTKLTKNISPRAFFDKLEL